MEKPNKAVTSIMNQIINLRTAIILLVLIVIISILSPYFFYAQNLINVLRQISVYGVIGVGATLIIASANLDFSIGAMITLIGVITASLSKEPGIPFWFVVIIGIGLGTGLGFANGMIGTFLKVPLFITTLAMAKVYEGASYLITHMTTITGIPKGFVFLGQGYIGPIPVPACIMAIVAIIFFIIINRTGYGRHILAIGGNPAAAHASGIHVNKTRTLAFTLMGICSACAALIMTGRAASAQPTAGLGMEMDAITAVVIGGTSLAGGKGKIFGTIIGCLIVGVINNGLNLVGVDSSWQVVAKGLMILFAVFIDIKTEGFFKKQIAKIQEA